MATKRTRVDGIDDWQVEFLLTGALPPDDAEGVNEWEVGCWE